jgi:hypothetical protein
MLFILAANLLPKGPVQGLSALQLRRLTDMVKEQTSVNFLWNVGFYWTPNCLVKSVDACVPLYGGRGEK